ncbi:hypothetical protein ACFP9V_18660 [Deinococcus radiopugnans]|uniref:hypothetical protein n=1 Tax=Deinococcus radiopugnans TaxID=57497 RepID=UPI003611F116
MVGQGLVERAEKAVTQAARLVAPQDQHQKRSGVAAVLSEHRCPVCRENMIELAQHRLQLWRTLGLPKVIGGSQTEVALAVSVGRHKHEAIVERRRCGRLAQQVK